jgi:cyclic pyranopterin phosphate synthase
MSRPLQDGFGRGIEYLRISVTDRCNFRCLYCMPVTGLQWLPKTELLSYEEIAAVVGELAPLGLRRIRITGGEPTLRADLDRLIGMLRDIPGVEDLALSTNGLRLPALAKTLATAGLDRVNMSADSLRPDRIRAIARRNIEFDPVAAATAAEEARLSPIKFNVVVMRGINDDEIADFAALTLSHPWHVRFIELMPVGEMRDATWERIVPAYEILERLEQIAPLVETPAPRMSNGPARYFRFPNAPGSIGLITPMSHTYCGSCNRVRLTADGRLRTCLFGEHEVDLRTPLREGLPLEPFFRAALAAKPKEHQLLQMRIGGLRALSQVGG